MKALSNETFLFDVVYNAQMCDKSKAKDLVKCELSIIFPKVGLIKYRIAEKDYIQPVALCKKSCATWALLATGTTVLDRKGLEENS